MTTSDQSGSESGESVRELLTFLREESASARDHLRNQATEDRELLTNTIKIVAFPLTALVAVAAVLGFKSLSDLKETIQREARNETKTEIARMHTETESQIKTMQVDIRQRLDQQFQTQNLREIVKDAAREQTQSSAKPLILSEVARQVKSRVDAEQGSIRNAVTTETQSAVKQMAPQIDKMVKNSVDSNIQTQVQPVQNQLFTLQKIANIQGLVNRMNADDAVAFDILVQTPLTEYDADVRTMVQSAIKSVVESHNSGIVLSRTFTISLTPDQMAAMLGGPDAGNRQAAIEALSGNVPLLPTARLAQLLSSDASLNVRASAHRIFNGRTQQKFIILDKDTTIKWWTQHQQEFVGK